MDQSKTTPPALPAAELTACPSNNPASANFTQSKPQLGDMAWGSATDCGDKFISTVRTDAELGKFFLQEQKAANSSYFSFAKNPIDKLCDEDMKKEIASIENEDWAIAFRALDSLRVIAMLRSDLLRGHEVQVVSSLLKLVCHLRSALQRNSLLTVSTFYTRGVKIVPETDKSHKLFADLLKMIVGIAGGHDKSFIRKAAKATLEIVAQQNPSESVAKAIGHPSNLMHKQTGIVKEAAESFFNCLKAAAKAKGKGENNILSSYRLDSSTYGICHSIALLSSAKLHVVRKIARSCTNCLRQKHAEASKLKLAYTGALDGDGVSPWFLSEAQANKLLEGPANKRKGSRMKRSTLRSLMNKGKKLRMLAESKSVVAEVPAAPQSAPVKHD